MMTHLEFKERKDEAKYPLLDFRLRHLVGEYLYWCFERRVIVVLVTDVDTPGVHMAGSPHYAGRAIDLSIHEIGLPAAEAFADWVNAAYGYSDTHNAAICGKWDPAGRHNDHLHLQVPGAYRATGKIQL
jgi:hypothetical protein